jgi:hypothetical protein
MDRYLGSGRGYSLEFEFIHEATILTSVRHSLMFNTPWPFPIYLPSSTTLSTRVSPFERVQSDGLHVFMTAKCLSPTISNTFLPSRIRIYQQYYAYRTPLTEDFIPPSILDRLCSQYAQLGARGVSVIYASGDSGPGDTYLVSNGTRSFTPIFPASSLFIISVGGTARVDPERAWSSSGGGFSHFFPRPAWQSA